jgi:hypothetical protein
VFRKETSVIFVRFEVFTAVAIKNTVYWNVAVISEIGTAVAVTSNSSTLVIT